MFEPVGAKARWRLLYDRIQHEPIETVLTYDQLTEVLDTDVREHRGDFYRAVKEMEREHHRTLDNVRGVGYRVVHPREHEHIAQRHQAKGFRQVRTARRKSEAADRSLLTVEERERLDNLESRVAQLESLYRRSMKRVTEVEKVAQTAKATADDTAGTLEQVMTLLREKGLIAEETMAA